MRKNIFKVVTGFLVLMGMHNFGNANEPESSSKILHDLRSFRETGSVLFIAAHPDDENNDLLAYLVQGRGFRTGYLSLTRGEGGQNLIGSEQGALLGVLRTQELLAARRVDGAQQFFSSAIDFGFTKDPEQTLKVWDRKRVLSEIVTLIRKFQPDIIMTRFSPEPSDTHGHHTASAILAMEAFKLAGDPKAFPEKDNLPWKAKRIIRNVGFFGSSSKDSHEPNLLELEAGGYDSLLGESYGEIGARSRSMHRSQGMGRGARRGSKKEYFKVLAGEPIKKDIFDGIDSTWDRIPGSEKIRKVTEEAIADFNPIDPSASIPLLLKLKDLVAALPKSEIIIYKNKQLNHILESCLGLHVETVVSEGQVVPGEELKLKHSIIARSTHPISLREIRYLSVKRDIKNARPLIPNQALVIDENQILPQNTPISQPYWLIEKPAAAMYQISDPSLAGQPENPPVFPVDYQFDVDGRSLVVEDHAVQVIVDAAKGEIRSPLEVVPPVSLSFSHDLELFALGSTHNIIVEVTSALPSVVGNIKLSLPAGWKAKPSLYFFKIQEVGSHVDFSFAITAPKKASRANIMAVASIGGVSYSSTRFEIRYDHIPQQLLQPPASLKVLSLKLKIHGRRIGYVPGAGDLVAESLERMGYETTELTDSDLSVERLKSFDAIVMGVRAVNVRSDLAQRMPALLEYVRRGGVLVTQYNTPDTLQTKDFFPYSLSLSNDRVTDPNAPVTILNPKLPIFTYPNVISASDFEGWVQERGRNFPDEWDSHYTPLLTIKDQTGLGKSGSLLVAHYGKGYYVYTGLSFFRQLPEGVRGAFRLFANLLSLK